MGSGSSEGTLTHFRSQAEQRRRSGRIYGLEAALTSAMGQEIILHGRDDRNTGERIIWVKEK